VQWNEKAFSAPGSSAACPIWYGTLGLVRGNSCRVSKLRVTHTVAIWHSWHNLKSCMYVKNFGVKAKEFSQTTVYGHSSSMDNPLMTVIAVPSIRIPSVQKPSTVVYSGDMDTATSTSTSAEINQNLSKNTLEIKSKIKLSYIKIK